MSDASQVSEPARAGNQPESNRPASTRAASTRYVAEFVDGPLEGTTEHRYLVDGQPEQQVTQMALVERTEAILWYTAGESRDVGGVLHVRYSFDAKDSDTLVGAADPDSETREL